MITVNYEEYTNDYCRRDKVRSFYDLAEFEDWFFGLCKGKFERDISIPKPDHPVWKDGPSALDCNNMWTENKHYYVHMISEDGKIIFSDGHHTNRQRHWNDTTKEMCRRMNKRKMNPQFNFG